MRFAFSDEQEELRRTVRRFLEDRSPTTEVRRWMEDPEGFDRSVWRQISADLGLPGVQIPEEYGGQGLGFPELGIVLEEMGRALYCAPYFSSVVLAANAILCAANETQKKDLLPRIASGETIATLALAEDTGQWDASGIALTATRADGALRLDGVKSFVLDGHSADLLIVVARAPGSHGTDGLTFAAVPSHAAGLERRLLTSLDPTRKLARLELSGVRAEPLGEIGSAGAALAQTLDRAAVALANEMVGAAQKVLETTLEYAKSRVQFGRQIGSFQVIKHRCADMLLEVELAKSVAYYAANAIADDADDVATVAPLAKAFASDAFVRAASDSIQIHGGVGFTWENDTHLYFKRAKSSAAFLGDPTVHRERLVQRLGL